MAKSKKSEDSAAVVADSIPQAVTSKLRKLVVKNFGCVGNIPVEVELDDIVVLVGPNNTGKSTILRAYQTITESASPKLTLEDFHERTIDPANPPIIELFTAVTEDLPGNRWIQKIDGENIVRERWSWNEPGVAAKRQGWDVTVGEGGDWSANVPWGAPNVANSRRPQPHRIEAFADPAKQIEEVTKLLLDVLQERVKEKPTEKLDEAGKPILGDDGKPLKTGFGELLDALGETQKSVVEEAKAEITEAEKALSKFVSAVFPKYRVKFDARPEENLLKCFNFFKAGAVLQMGVQDGHLSNADRQGSGARRTLMWAALRFIAETTEKDEGGVAHLLLLDEPELCLHPNAIREACDTLYGLPSTGKWQVMVTTHSPCFIDLSRDNTTVVRVQRDEQDNIRSTTVFRPSKAKLDEDEKRELKLLNIYDPHVAEFFFGGRTVLVEGDTEYTAFKYIVSNDNERELFTDVHVVRARGKVTIGLLAKILNQFNARFAALHDSDTPTVKTRKGNVMKNPAWTNNEKILAGVGKAYDKKRIRLVASLINFERAMFGEEVDEEKPYNAFETMKAGGAAYGRVKQLLVALLDFEKPLPNECLQWEDFTQFEAEFQKRFPPPA